MLPCSSVSEIPEGYKPDTQVPFLGGNPASILRDMDSRAQLKEEGGKGPQREPGSREHSLWSDPTGLSRDCHVGGYSVLLPVSLQP